jgi:hypothetical protein
MNCPQQQHNRVENMAHHAMKWLLVVVHHVAVRRHVEVRQDDNSDMMTRGLCLLSVSCAIVFVADDVHHRDVTIVVIRRDVEMRCAFMLFAFSHFTYFTVQDGDICQS